MLPGRRWTVLLLSIALASVPVACTTTHTRAPTPRELSAASRITLTSGEVIVAKDISNGADSSLEFHRGGQVDRVYATQIREVRSTNHGKGFIQGLGLGMLIGGGTGVVLGYAIGDEDSSSENANLSAGARAVFLGLALGLLGGGGGAVIGAARGTRDVYKYNTSQVGVLPTQGGGQATLSFQF